VEEEHPGMEGMEAGHLGMEGVEVVATVAENPHLDTSATVITTRDKFKELGWILKKCNR